PFYLAGNNPQGQ
ncbi:hypothetical protein CARUB_v100127393mg, partial [Capsella rubella]